MEIGEKKLNILIETGSDFVLGFTVYDEDGNPTDLTGASVQAQLREFSESSELHEFHCTHNGTGGHIVMTMPHEETAQIGYSYGIYDVHVTLSDGFSCIPLYGDAKIQPGVTKPFDGTMLYMIGVSTYEDLPTEGIVNRLYFCYDDRKIYRWNGVNYIGTAVGNGVQKVEFVRHADEFTDVYRMYFDDGTYFEYTIFTKGIERIEKIGSRGDAYSGVIDTYRMYFNTGTYWDYQVTNGKIMYATFGVNFDSGHLVMDTINIPSGMFPEFELDEYGHLMMDTEPVIELSE